MMAVLAFGAATLLFNPDSVIHAAEALAAEQTSLLSRASGTVTERDAFNKETACSINGRLLRVEWNVSEGAVNKSVTWHFHNDALYLCRQTWLDLSAADTLLADDKFYFSGMRLVAWIDKSGAPGDTCSTDYLEAAQGIPLVAAKLMMRYR